MQDRHETNRLKTLLGDALQQSNVDPRLIAAFEMGYVTEASLAALNNWFMEDYPELRKQASAHELSWGDEFRRQLIFLKNRTDLSTHQDLILSALTAILKKEGSTDEEFIASLEQGHCAGFSVLVSYALWLENQPKRDPSKPRDDWTWVSSVFNLLATWTPDKTFSAAQMADINRLLALIRGFQYANTLEPTAQGDLAKITDTRDQEFFKLFAIGSKFTANETQTLLDKIEALNPEQADFQIMAASHDHELSINRINGEYIFYDSINMKGPISIQSKHLSFLISVSNAFSPTASSPLSLSVFSTNKQLRFPDIGSFLAQTEQMKRGYNHRIDFNDALNQDAYNALHMATLSGSLESVRFLLNTNFPINTRTLRNAAAIDIAIANHHADIAEFLLQRGAILKPDLITSHLNQLVASGDLQILGILAQERGHEIEAALYDLLDASVRQNRGDVIEVVLQKGLLLTENKIKEFAMIATQMDNVYALSILMQHGANPLATYSPRGENLLHYAVKHDRVDMVKLLLKHIPSNQMNAKRNDGLTALQLAHNPEIRTLLTTHAHTPSVHALFTHAKPTPILPTEPTDLKNKPK